MKTESGDLPLVAVGGGRLSRARSGRRNLAGDPRAARRLRQCGGSAIAQISGEDRPGLSRPRPRQGNRVRQSANAGAPGRRWPSRCSTSFRDLRSNWPSTQSEFGSEEEVVPKAPSQGGTESSNLLSSSGESSANRGSPKQLPTKSRARRSSAGVSSLAAMFTPSQYIALCY